MRKAKAIHYALVAFIWIIYVWYSVVTWYHMNEQWDRQEQEQAARPGAAAGE
jgi:hypothetical protein